MKNTVSLKLNREFQRVYKKGNYKAGRFLVIYTLENRLNYNRLGISTGKRFGNSVQRNRMRRLIKEIYRLMESSFYTGYDIVIMAKASERGAATNNNRLKAINVPDFEATKKDFIKLVTKLNLINLM